MRLPSDAKDRKGIPLATGVLDYFPDALAELAKLSKAGNDQHNPGQPLHWAREKSTDHADCILRHMIDRGTHDADGLRHSAKVAWRALAMLQTEIENDRTTVEKVPSYKVEEYFIEPFVQTVMPDIKAINEAKKRFLEDRWKWYCRIFPSRVDKANGR